MTYYRGGPTLAPRRIDVIINRKTGLVMPGRGVSIADRSDGLDRFGGAFEVGTIPNTLEIVGAGRNPHHFEIAPKQEMTFEQYEAELAKISLTKV
ncbi:MAG: hypothetical protein HYX68_23065 [Planctomycetes bacterium]|nr:hypothetical protein [Planctomycetota bacterium]